MDLEPYKPRIQTGFIESIPLFPLSVASDILMVPQAKALNPQP